MMLRVFVCLFFILWFAVLNIMDFVDLYEGAEKMFPMVIGGKYQYIRTRLWSFNATLNSSPFLIMITILVYPSCKQGVIYFVEVCYLMIYIFLYFVIKAKREENLKKDARKKCLNDIDYVVRNVVKGNSEMKVADKEMLNPWESISLSDYEKHMSLDSVKQLQALNELMKEQLNRYNVSTAMILGVAGGNGLEYVDKSKYQRVYGVDINADYLEEVSKRYSSLDGVLECIHLDLMTEADKLQVVELVIANLLIEYIGYEAFQKIVKQVKPVYVSCVIQINADDEKWVSDSPYLRAFDGLDKVHHQMEEKRLSEIMGSIGYIEIEQEMYPLPNGKALIRLDYEK